MDPVAYKKQLFARILRIAGAGTAGLTALATAQCGARSGLPGSSAGAGGLSGAGGAPSTTTGLGGATSSPTGFGGAPGTTTGFGGAAIVSSVVTTGFGGGIGGGFGGAGGMITMGVTVGVGGGPTDGGPPEAGEVTGVACLPEQPGDVCPSPGQAIGLLNNELEPRCSTVVTILGGPSIEGNACCYDVIVKPFPCYVGRTFFVDEGIVKAELRPGRTWRAGASPAVDGLPGPTRKALAEAWARDGLFEHASVASFSRFAMQLLALGAPADLVRDTHAGAMDEVRHAELCLALASAYFGENVEPAPLPMPDALAVGSDLPAITAEVALEGCIGETVAAVQAAFALAQATDPAVRAVLQVTVEDETRHADLGWRFLAWALDVGGQATRMAVIESFMGFRPPAPREERFDEVDLALYEAHGRQTAVEARAIADRTLREVVQPAVCAMLSRRRAETGPAATVLPHASRVDQPATQGA